MLSNGYVFEVEPSGTLVAIETIDSPGVIGHVGTVLASNNINIKQFEFSREEQGEKAMALVVADDEITAKALEELKDHRLFIKVRKIQIS